MMWPPHSLVAALKLLRSKRSRCATSVLRSQGSVDVHEMSADVRQRRVALHWGELLGYRPPSCFAQETSALM